MMDKTVKEKAKAGLSVVELIIWLFGPLGYLAVVPIKDSFASFIRVPTIRQLIENIIFFGFAADGHVSELSKNQYIKYLNYR